MVALKLQEKITGLLLFYFLVSLAAISSTLYVSWLLEGGAAAINDAGSERMRSYHIAFLLTQQVQQPSDSLRQAIKTEIAQFEKVLLNLDRGDPRRPLALPKDKVVREQMGKLHQAWRADLKPRIQRILDTPQRSHQELMLADYKQVVESYVSNVNELVSMVESSNAHAATLLRSFQIGLVSVALVGTVLMMNLFLLIVVRPVNRLREGIQRMGRGDFGVRLQVTKKDEFGELADGFNQMADKLQNLYVTLEQRVEEKSRSVEVKNRELAALYDVATFLNSSTATEPLCGIVLEKLAALMGARDGVVRLVDSTGEKMQIVASRGVSEAFLVEEACLAVGNCLCGAVSRDGISVSSNFSTPSTRPLLHACKREGFQGVVAVPIRSKQRVMGILNLFFDTPRILPQSEVRLLESVGQHLGVAIENQRLVAREKEMAVSEERNLLAQELHDSIAQSLAFLNIQVQLLRTDLQQGQVDTALQGVEQISEGVQESYDDVRELLVHFRTRVGNADLGTAVRSALEKFEGQTGINAVFSHQGTVPDLLPEQVLQAMHIVQESLSNVRKHARASRVDVALECNGECTLYINDNGTGFDAAHDAGVNHVGLSIMRERAHRIGAEFALESQPGQGTRVRLVLPQGRGSEA
ncbi:MAG TPA: type IV pili methyl-accepting chemotaxis transducer N-terminal domain-containing protein [Gallionellaceae bacterium]|nr:type IV pili methyl-accepting chemotaxis transducer N-terminal domain-containing protein [Gallionellaceae bacterium]